MNLEKLLKPFIPLLFAQLANLPLADKRLFAEFVAKMCDLYVQGDRETFQATLDRTNITVDWKTNLVNALWSGNEDQKK